MTGPATSILVVDDSASKRYVICSWLRRANFQITEATTGAEALARMEDTRVDLVVLDVKLPDLSGFEVCERIKSNPAHASTPVIHVSAAAVQTVDRTQGLDRGADAYLVEPIDPDELLATIQAILRYYRGRQNAERLAARLSTLAGVTLVLAQAKSAGRLLADAVAGAAVIYQSPAMVCAENSDGRWLSATVDGPGARPMVRAWTPKPGVYPAAGTQSEVAREAAGVSWADRSPVRIVAAAGRPDHSPVYVVVPEPSTDPGAPVLTLVGQAVAAAMETMRAYTVEHQLALTLQHSLLPQQLPQVAGVDLAKRYVPASQTAEIGGDFYELSELGHLLVVAVGDVGGHSLHAATVMAELRHAMRAYIVEGHAPAAVIDRLNALMRHYLPNEIATLCLLTFDPSTGTIVLANAGHPAPLIVTNDSVTQLTEHGSLLGLSTIAGSQREFILPPGATLVLYTDGLVERRGEHIDQGISRLMAAATHPDRDLDAYCDRLLRTVGPEVPSDDIAVVVVRRHA